MLASRMNLCTLREDPSEAEIASHRLLTRSGFIAKSGAGLYLYAPLMQRTLDKAKRIIAEEISRAGGLEITMPILQEQGLWERSGRWATYQASRTMLTVRDRADQVFGLAPTAEEVVTDYAGKVVSSYKQLPVCFFQQTTKFRDEIRPRFGLMRVKEFIMMDAYSFHASPESLDETYEAMRVAYFRAFQRLGLEAFAVEADTGAIGGSGSHEFMVAASVGEDAIDYCSACGYAANLEKAVGGIAPAASWSAPAAATLVATPQVGTITDVVGFLNANGHPEVRPEHLVKTLLVVAKTAKGELPIAACVRGDREVNLVKLQNHIAKVTGDAVLDLRPMHPEEILSATGAGVGFAGPTAGMKVCFVVIDQTLKQAGPVVIGANKTDHHVVGFDLSRDLPGDVDWTDLTAARAGDACPHCGKPLAEKRGIEVGHIFKLGTKYSQAMGAEFLGPDQKRHPFVMGCYGIGSSRVVAAAVEQHHDADGLRWPITIAPYQVVIVAAGKPGDAAVEGAAKQLYTELQAAGIDVVLDDRDAKPGVKFKDWDLIGIPLRVVAGRGVAEGKLEVKPRGGESSEVAIAEAAQHCIGWVRNALSDRQTAADAVR